MFQLFAGKGGVGKTTCAAAVAVGLAEAGSRVLVVSTDPAHSLGDALGTSLTGEPVRVQTRSGELLAAELDAGQAVERWLGARRSNLEQLVERGTFLDQQDVERILDLSLPGLDELIGLIELVRLAEASGAEEVVVDTAPTAHTLRLLAMPGRLLHLAGALDRLQEKHRLLAERFGHGHQPDRADALIDEIARQAADIQAILHDPAQCRIRWVLLPEALAVAETRDGVGELEAAGMAVRELIVNRVTPTPDAPCFLCDAKRRAERDAVEELRAYFPGTEIHFLSAREEPRRLPALRQIARELAKPSPPGPLSRGTGEGERKTRQGRKKNPSDPLAWLRVLPSNPRLLFFGGKGGVGKTTCAAAAALMLAVRRPGDRVLLLSTDPAHSLADVLEVPLGDDERPIPEGPPNLRARELDAARTFEEWRQRHWPALEEGIGEAADFREILQLAPPGLAEMSAVSTLIDALFGTAAEPPYALVVVDTAPTGHALQLLEMPDLMLEWVRTLLALLLKYREAVGLGRFAEELVELSKSLRQLGELLRDPERTGFVAVTRAAELPRRETVRLLEAVNGLGLAVPAVIVDAVTPKGCATCQRAAEKEERQIRWLEGAVKGQQGQQGQQGQKRRSLKSLESLSSWEGGGKTGRCAIILAPAVFPPPRGAGVLAEWVRTWKNRSS